MRISFSMDKPIPSVRQNPEFNSKIKDVLRHECNRIRNYAKDHHEFAYRDRTGQLSRAIQAWSLRHTKYGYTMQVGIKEEPLILERWRGYETIRGKTTIDLATWLATGTRSHGVPKAGFFFFRGYHSYSSGNMKGSMRGWWKVKHPINGIEARTDFVQNAFTRTKKYRMEAFSKLLQELKIK